MSLRHAVDGIFARKGTLSRVLDPFEWRPQQAQMADAICQALTQSEVLIVEAPTGVGKSLAYLIPGALWAREEQKVTMVSTHTKNLQDQILKRDLPLLRRLTDRRIQVAVLKGRGNYLCRRRWEIARGDLSGTTDGEAFVRALEGWVQVTALGDIDDGPPIAPRLRGLLSRIVSDQRFCSTEECDPDDGCFFKLSRRRARDAHVVLVNHSLLVIELLSGSAGLPPHDALIVDEAHHLPRIAGEALARKVSLKTWTAAFAGLGGQGEPGATDRIRRIVRLFPAAADRTRWQTVLRTAEAQVGEFLDQSRGFFNDLRGLSGYPAAGGRARYRLGVGSGGPFPESTYPLLETAAQRVEDHARMLRELAERITEPDAVSGLMSEVAGAVEAARGVLSDLTFLAEVDDPGTVYWIEDDLTEGPALRSRPLDLSGSLGERLVSGRPLILTSATLAADGTAGFFATQCGLHDAHKELLLPPVFDLDKQVRFLVPSTIHDPGESGHETDLAQGIIHLASQLPRKILVLFTAHETLRRVEEAIRGPLEDRGIRVYAQGRDGGRAALAALFQKSERAVLLGAASFWEGVDFPGEDLEILVMARLPFPVPTDPFVEAYAERLREEGQEPFGTYMLPEAIVRFRQGFGRLIRRRDDRGIFAVLDPRILRRGYGSRFVQAIGIPAQTVASWDELVRAAEGWFRALDPSPDGRSEKP